MTRFKLFGKLMMLLVFPVNVKEIYFFIITLKRAKSMFGTVANGTLLGCKYICSPLKSKVSTFGFVEIFGL